MSAARSNRRDFLRGSVGLAAAGMAVPCFCSRVGLGAESKGEKLTVAAIGVGGRGSDIGNQAAQLGSMVACCDVDSGNANRFAEGIAKQNRPKPVTYGDYRKVLERKDVQAVTIGTPDHWHAKIAIEAMKAGKDVYCEKPLTLTIDEGRRICKAVEQSRRVFQVGTQQRSSARFFLPAVALARSGRLGKPLKVTCSIGKGPASEVFPASDPPQGLDWDLWLGQAPKVPYTRQRCHGTFRWWLEYSGGKLTDWGAHHVDIAQWAIGCERTGPVEIQGKGEFPGLPRDFDPVAFFAGKLKLPDRYNTATEFHIDLKFANGSQIHVQHGPDNGIWIEGERGKIFVNRSKITGKPIEELSDADKEWLRGEMKRLYKGREPAGHMQNFFDCVKGRAEPVSDVFTHHRALSSCHLCNIAMLLKRKLAWDPVQEDFVGDDQASALVARPQRKPYTVTL